MSHHVDVEGYVVTRSQLSVATDADEEEDGFPADVVLDMQAWSSQMKQMVGSLLLMCWKGIVNRAWPYWLGNRWMG